MFKPFDKGQKVADCVYEEFFQQGDQEKALGLRYSQELMDRSKMPEIPRMQVSFFQFIVVPAFNQLQAVFGNPVNLLIESVSVNKSKWEELRDNGIEYCSARH
jgi:hypothetical protein